MAAGFLVPLGIGALNFARTQIPRIGKGIINVFGKRVPKQFIPAGTGATTTKTFERFTPLGAGDFLSKIKQIQPKRFITYTKEGKPYSVSIPGGTVTPKGVGDIVPYGAGTTTESVISGGQIVPYGAGTTIPGGFTLSKKGMGLLGLGGYGAYKGAQGLFDDDEDTQSLKDFLKTPEVTAEKKTTSELKEDIQKYKDDPSVDQDAFKAQYEKYKELFGDGKEEAKTQANYNLMQLGLNLLTERGDNFLEIFGKAAKDPVKNLQALAYDVAKQDKEIKAAAVARVESKEDQAFAAQQDLDKIMLQQDFQKEFLKNEKTIELASSLYTQGLTTYGDVPNDPRVGMYTRIEGENIAKSSLGQELGMNVIETDEVIPSNEDLTAFYEVVSKAKKKNNLESAKEAIDEFKEAFGVTELTAIDFYNLVASNQDYFGL